MSILITILSVIAGIILLILIIAAFIKQEYTLQKEIVINSSRQHVFNYIKLLDNQNRYNKWVMADPGMKQVNKGVDGTIGFVTAWDSNNKNVGKGEQEIKSITEGERITYEIHFERPFEGVMQSGMSLSSLSSNQTELVWASHSKVKYPMNITRLFTDNMLKKDMETSLNNLKTILENNN